MDYPMYRSARRRALAGITLIEVMMSAMIVGMGLLGLIALIPLGTHLTERGTRADRVASIGQRAYHEAKIRGYLNPASWVSPTGGGLGNFVSPAPHTTSSRLPVRQPYLIDPWFFPDNFNDGNRRYFPASEQYAIGGGIVGGGTGPRRMHRLSVLSGPNSPNRMPRRQASINFMSEDDLSVERPSDGQQPPFQTFYTRDDDANIPVRRQSQGDYTWMFMLVPELRSVAGLGPPGGSAAALTPPINFHAESSVQGVLNNNVTDEYNLSVVVMQKRQSRVPAEGTLTTDGTDLGERVLEVPDGTFISTDGYSTGEVRLQINSSGSTEDDENMLRLSNGDWICLAGRADVGSYPAGDIYQWCRVSSVSDIYDDPNNGRPSIDVTFTGPDWSSLAASPTPPSHAIIVEGVVGVYTKRVRLDLSTY